MDDIRMPGPYRQPTVTFTGADATPTVAEGSLFLTSGTTTITDFDDGQVGDIKYIKAQSNIEVTDSASVVLKGALDFKMSPQDVLALGMFDDQVWYEIGRNERSRYKSLTTTKTLVEGDTGKTYFLNSAGGFSVVLPAPNLGCEFTFIVATAPTTAYTIDTNSGDNIMHGLIIDIDATTPTLYATARDIISFVAATSVVGDKVHVVSDGTSWFYTAISGADGGITTGQT
jgi:hypothetical protein